MALCHWVFGRPQDKSGALQAEEFKACLISLGYDVENDKQVGAQSGFGPSAWRPESCCVPVCPPGVSVALCCFSSTRLPLTLSVCQVLSSAVNCLCFFYIFFSPPNITHFLSNILTSLFLFITPSFPLLPSSSSSHSSLSLSGLCCAVAAYRSDQDRWSQMISGLYSFLQETAWYCC